MALSKKGIFKVRIRDKSSQQEFPLILAPTKEYYICVQPGIAFTIGLEKAGHDYNVYAPKLFIDGQEVAGFKTLPKVCNYHGFKMGGGVYKEFVFSEPPVIQREQVFLFSLRIVMIYRPPNSRKRRCLQSGKRSLD